MRSASSPLPTTRLLIFHSPTLPFTSFLALPCFSVSHFCRAHWTVHILAAFLLLLLQGHLKHHLLPRGLLHSPRWMFVCGVPPTAPIFSYVLLRTLVLCCCSSLYCKSSEVDMLSIIIANHTTVSTVLGAQMVPRGHLLDSLAQDNISPAGKSVCPCRSRENQGTHVLHDVISKGSFTHCIYITLLKSKHLKYTLRQKNRWLVGRGWGEGWMGSNC